jgi:hypothetical protein
MENSKTSDVRNCPTKANTEEEFSDGEDLKLVLNADSK